MTNAQTINMMLEELKSVATPQRKARLASNFPTSMRVLGVSEPDLKLVVKNWTSMLYDFTPQQWFGLSLELAGQGILECQMLAYELLWENKKAL